jgi:HK97 family phage major capsid protein
MDQKQIDDLVLQINLLDKKVQEFDKMKEKGFISASDFKEREDKINAAQDVMAKEIAKLRVPQVSSEQIKEDGKTAIGKAFDKLLRKGLQALGPDERKVLTISDDTTGGYLETPPDYVQEIIKGVTLYSPFRSVARVRNTASNTIQVPKRTASFSAIRVSEIGTKSERTGLAYGLEEMKLGEVYADVRISKQNIEDSAFNLQAEIASEIIEQFAVLEGTEFITGTGANDIPEGILTNAELKVEGTGCRHTASADTIVTDDLLSVQYLLKEAYVKAATWLMKRDVVGYIRKLKYATSNEYIWQPSLAGGVPATLLGSPVLECTDMPGLTGGALITGEYPVAYGDFGKGYLIGERIGLEIQRLDELFALSSTIGFLARKRYNGQVVLSEAIKLLMIE